MQRKLGPFIWGLASIACAALAAYYSSQTRYANRIFKWTVVLPRLLIMADVEDMRLQRHASPLEPRGNRHAYVGGSESRMPKP